MYQMQHWASVEARWEPMEDGPAARIWRPRETAEEAIAKCEEWTGYSGIPAMRVVDLDTRRVVWMDVSHYPEASA